MNIDKLIRNPDMKKVCLQGLGTELGRLDQGFKPNQIKGTNTISFVKIYNTFWRKITYTNCFCNLQPLKKKMYQVQMTVCGDKLDYPHDIASPTSALLDTKLIIDSTISDHKYFGSKFRSIDIEDFFLQTIMDEGIYGLKQTVMLAYKRFVQQLNEHDLIIYVETKLPDYSRHERKTFLTEKTKICTTQVVKTSIWEKTAIYIYHLLTIKISLHTRESHKSSLSMVHFYTLVMRLILLFSLQ